MREKIFRPIYFIYNFIAPPRNVYLSHGRAGLARLRQFGGGDSYVTARKDPLERKITRIVRFGRPMRGTKERERAR